MLTDVRRRRGEILKICPLSRRVSGASLRRGFNGSRGSGDRQTIQDFIQEIGQYRALRTNTQRTDQQQKPC